MYILYASDVNQSLEKLSLAWDNSETFIFLPERSGVSEQWVKQTMNQIPEKFSQHHFVLLTSGSTGQPKLIIASRLRAEKLIKIINQLQDGDAAEETILALPLSYCYAFVNQWLWSLVFKKQLIFTLGFSQPDQFKERLSVAKNAMMCLVYPQVPLLVRYFGENAVFPGIIRLHFAGGPFPQNDIHIVHRVFPNAKVFNNYGCAEAMPRLTIRPEKDSQEGSNIGKPLPGVVMKTDEDSRILFQSDYSAVAFFDETGLIEVTPEMWIPSGDLGEELENGYWRIKGRANEVFKRFGEKVSIPQLLKTVYENWAGQAAFYREKEISGEEGHVLVLSPEPTEKQFRAILKAFRKNHPRAQWPVRLESVVSFPLLENEKIDKLALAKQTNKKVHWFQRG
jgi:acyl-coenzyme A synthetase/AMP-(fatty) acid ligase